jgi:hypothetical protein
MSFPYGVKSKFSRRKKSMRKTRFQRITAFALALVFLLCGGLSVGAADVSSNNALMGDIGALLNSVSYKTYLDEHADVPKATEEVVVNATEEYLFTPDGKHFYNQNGFAYLLDSEGNKNTDAADPYASTPETDVLAGVREYDSKKDCMFPVTELCLGISRCLTRLAISFPRRDTVSLLTTTL